MEAVDKEVEKDVERVLRTEFMSNGAAIGATFELMADIFNNFDRLRKPASCRPWMSAARIRQKKSAL